jgi:hypothetical protein
MPFVTTCSCNGGTLEAMLPIRRSHNFRPVNSFWVRYPQQHRDVVGTEGNFKEYDADLRRRKGADADTPHRVTYKKLCGARPEHV